MNNKQLSFCSGEDGKREAIDFIQNNLSDKGTIFVGFSGGKDSIVTADLMKKSGVTYQLYYSATGIDAPEVVRFIRREYPDCEFLYPRQNFWYHLTRKNPPSNFHRWCCRELKKLPSKDIKIRHRVMGIRAEEGTKRAKYKLIEHIYTLDVFHYSPILNWKEGDIWEYIEENKLPYPELYDQGLSRIGCVVCPFHSNASGKGHDFYKKRWPRYFKLFEKKCSEWFEKRKKQGREMFFDTAEDFVENWYLGNVQWYKREEKKNNQLTFTDFL